MAAITSVDRDATIFMEKQVYTISKRNLSIMCVSRWAMIRRSTTYKCVHFQHLHGKNTTRREEIGRLINEVQNLSIVLWMWDYYGTYSTLVAPSVRLSERSTRIFAFSNIQHLLQDSPAIYAPATKCCFHPRPRNMHFAVNTQHKIQVFRPSLPSGTRS